MPPAAGLREEMAAYNRAALAWFEQHIHIGMERGNTAPCTDTDTDPTSTAVVLLGAMRGVMQQRLDNRITLAAVRARLLHTTEQVLRRE